MANLVILAAIAALAAGAAAAQTVPLVQATKPVCKSNPREPTGRPPVCRGGTGRLTAPDICSCEGGEVKFELPACWQDGRPAMHRPGMDFTAREYESLVACEDLKHSGGR